MSRRQYIHQHLQKPLQKETILQISHSRQESNSYKWSSKILFPNLSGVDISHKQLTDLVNIAVGTTPNSLN